MSDKERYKNRCLYYTNKNKHLVPNIHLRSWDNFHLDHIVPISYGYKHNIPPSLIGSVENLQIIPRTQNLRKGSKIFKDALLLIDKWHVNKSKDVVGKMENKITSKEVDALMCRFGFDIIYNSKVNNIYHGRKIPETKKVCA